MTCEYAWGTLAVRGDRHEPLHQAVYRGRGGLFKIEKSFRMPKSDLRARPVYHRKRDSTGARLTVVFAALAVSRWIEAQARLVNQEIRQDRPPLPHHADPGRPAHDHRRRPSADDLRQALDAINRIS
jgi:hypothetical protein